MPTSMQLYPVFNSFFATLQELEDLERRGQGIKTKMETQAKYGW